MTGKKTWDFMMAVMNFAIAFLAYGTSVIFQTERHLFFNDFFNFQTVLFVIYGIMSLLEFAGITKPTIKQHRIMMIAVLVVVILIFFFKR